MATGSGCAPFLISIALTPLSFTTATSCFSTSGFVTDGVTVFSVPGFSAIDVFGRVFFSSLTSKGCFSARLTSSCFIGAEDILAGTGEILEVGAGANLFDKTADSA